MTSEPTTQDVFIPAGEGRLGGAWTSPATNVRAAAIIVPGSGPTDRDGNNPLGVRAASYRLLAEALAARGIATLRIDKRGMFSSASALSNANAVLLADYAADLVAWSAEIRRRSGLRNVFLIGHSEGGLAAIEAALAAQESAQDGVGGLILAAAPGRKLGDILREQLAANPANAFLMEQAFDAIARIERGEGVEQTTLHPALAQLFNADVQGFLADLMARDPADMLARVTAPVLVVQGDADIQIALEDTARLAHARGGVKLVIIEGVNHVLKAAPADRAANIAIYGREDLPIDARVVEAIAAFILEHASEG